MILVRVLERILSNSCANVLLRPRESHDLRANELISWLLVSAILICVENKLKNKIKRNSTKLPKIITIFKNKQPIDCIEYLLGSDSWTGPHPVTPS